jgi:hypothetical protein
MQIRKIALYLILETVTDKMIRKLLLQCAKSAIEVEAVAVHLGVSGWNEVLQGSHKVKSNCATYESYMV